MFRHIFLEGKGVLIINKSAKGVHGNENHGVFLMDSDQFVLRQLNVFNTVLNRAPLCLPVQDWHFGNTAKPGTKLKRKASNSVLFQFAGIG